MLKFGPHPVSAVRSIVNQINHEATGVQAYGIGPLSERGELAAGRGAHGNDERILERSLHDFVRFQWYAVIEVAASK